MFLEWTIRLLAAIFPSGRGDAVALWSELEETSTGGLVSSSKVVLINDYPGTPVMVYCSDANLAQLMVIRSFVREMISAVKRGAVVSHPKVESALQEIAPIFSGVVVLVSSRNCRGVTLITNPVMGSTVADDECLFNVEAAGQSLSNFIDRLRSTAVQPVSVESAGTKMTLIPWWGPLSH